MSKRITENHASDMMHHLELINAIQGIRCKARLTYDNRTGYGAILAFKDEDENESVFEYFPSRLKKDSKGRIIKNTPLRFMNDFMDWYRPSAVGEFYDHYVYRSLEVSLAMILGIV